jgi:ATP-binding cassette subfamily B protein
LAENIENILHKMTKHFIKAITTLIISFSVTYSVNPVFFYILIIWFFLFTTFSILMSNRLVFLSNKHANSESILSGQIVDCISNNSNIRIFATKDYEISRMNSFFKKTEEAFSKKEFFAIIIDGTQGIMIATMIGSALYFLIKLYGSKLITNGDFALIIGLSMDLAYCIWYTMFQVDEFNQALGKCNQSLNAIITSQEINKNEETTKEISVISGKLIFNNVSFNYKNSKSIFQSLNVKINPSEKVGIVGYSGGGKTTFVNLILKLYDVTDGQILIDGQDIASISQESLRRNISMISQDPSLFNRSIIDNIKYGAESATEKEIFEAAKKAHAHEFIEKLSNGYNSAVGERGLVLSGGQRQRISIARAILKNAPILILDEATSALDSITENLIQESLWTLMQNRTTIVIAHRLSTLLGMDRILVFDEGEIIQDGSHAKLIIEDGLYKKLWNAQSGGFLPDKKHTEST